MSMEPKTIAFLQASIDAEGSITTQRSYNCTVSGGGVGIYNVLVGQGGADSDLCMVNVIPQTAAAGGAGTARAPFVVHSSDVAKQLVFMDDANAAADPAGFWLEIKRYPPLPNP